MTDQATPVYQLRYSLTREDIAAFEFLPRELQGAEKLWLFGPVLACGAAVGLFEDRLRPFLPWDPSERWGQLLTVLIAVVIGYGASLLLLTVRARRRIAKAVLPTAPIAIDAFGDRMTVTRDGKSWSLAWSDVAVRKSDGHVFLAYAPGEAIIVPLRAFGSPEAVVSFANFAEEMGRDGDDRSAVPGNNNKKETAA